MAILLRPLLAAVLCSGLLVPLQGQAIPGRVAGPTVRLVRAPRIVMPGQVDSNVPLAWSLVDGRWRLFALTSGTRT
jgi:hypothetical protein